MSIVKLSIVTTLFNSAPYIEEFHRRISAEAKRITEDYEIIMVDDGSPDNSLEKAIELLKNDPRLKIIELSRNFGHHKAMMTGIEQACGENVFLIDVDLEEPPELLGEFYTQLSKDDWDVIYGCQEKRNGEMFKKWGGAISWWLMDMLLPTKIPSNHSTVRLMKSNYVRALVRHREHKTAIGGLWVETGFKQKAIQFNKLFTPTTGYHLKLRVGALLDSVTSFSERPLYIIFFVGLAILFLSTIVFIVLLALWCSGKTPPGWISVLESVWFLGGLAIFCIGVIGLYLSRIFIETKMRPYTIVRQIYSNGDLQR